LHSKTPGNGKTSWACRFIQNYFLVSWPKYTFEYPLALFVSVPRYLLALKDNIGSKNEYANFVSNNIMKADLVVFDDIAAKVGTDFELNHLLNIINTRLELRKSSIFTTNLDRNELVIALGDRLASRICNSSLDVALHGKDKRNLAVV
jgi:DNA replication protein DnaC